MQDERQLVVFKLLSEEYGVDISCIQEIIRMIPFTKLPHLPDFIEGVINLRGRIIPIVDLKKKFQQVAGEADNNRRIIIIDLPESFFGIIVDSVSEVLKISTDLIEPPPTLQNTIQTQYVTGVANVDNRMLILLDIRSLFDADVTKIINEQQIDKIKDEN